MPETAIFVLSFDAYVTLGNLMRRKGGVGRAIAIHQNLVGNPELDVLGRCSRSSSVV